MFLSMAFTGAKDQPSQSQQPRSTQPWSATVNWKPRDDVVSSHLRPIPDSQTILQQNENRRAVAILTFLDDEQMYLGMRFFLVISVNDLFMRENRLYARLYRVLFASIERDSEKSEYLLSAKNLELTLSNV